MDVGISAQVESLDAAVSEWAQACIIVFGDGDFAIMMTSRTMRGTNSRTSRSMSLAGNSRVHVGISAQADSFAEANEQMVCSSTKQRAKKMLCARDANSRTCGRILWRLYSAIQLGWHQGAAQQIFQKARACAKTIAIFI